MQNALIIANWKSHKTIDQSIAFLQEFKTTVAGINLSNKEIVICPSFHALSAVKEFVKHNNLPVKIGAQNISKFAEGAYTGEVAASQIKDLVEYAIIGHSERRDNFAEITEDIQAKVTQALSNGIIPVACVQNENNPVPEGSIFVAYEPPTAIGSGNPDDPTHIEQVFSSLESKYSGKKFLYGGSVTPENAIRFVQIPTFAGFLIGGASLEAASFCKIISLW